MSAFTSRVLGRVNKPVHRLGLAMSFGLDANGFSAALERGLNYVFWGRGPRPLRSIFREALRKDREKYVVATGPTLGFTRGSMRRAAERMLKLLGTDYLDVFQLYWLGKMSRWSDGIADELVKLREEGKVRAIGTSIHDRPRAGKLAESSPLDLLMIRYNAAHPGAEQDIFPHLAARKPSIIAYTATSWRRLLKAPSGWTGPAMTAGDCYRFCLSNPNVDVVLCGPASLRELEEDLAAVEKGPLQPDEEKWMRDYGRAVHG
jgi:aryl-alcohol dehydrogenase-like predicted oxidoreductase